MGDERKYINYIGYYKYDECINWISYREGGAPTSNPHGLELGLSTPGTANGPRPWRAGQQTLENTK